jgi:threonine dehydrogenase-like Zn-dependent dehydrogenase
VACAAQTFIFKKVISASEGGAHLPLQAVGANLPLTLGHEIYGHILDYGPEAGLTEDDRGRPVIVYPWIGCGECEACRNGLDNACLAPQSDHQNLGLQRPGGFGEKVIVRDPRSPEYRPALATQDLDRMGEAILHPPKQCLEKQLQPIPLGRLG